MIYETKSNKGTNTKNNQKQTQTTAWWLPEGKGRREAEEGREVKHKVTEAD